MRWLEKRLLEDDVVEQRFDLEFEGRIVPGLLWLPAATAGPRPLVLAGHGLATSKRSLFPPTLVHDLVTRYRFAVAALDAPGHGDRQPDRGQDIDAVLREWRAHWRQFGASQIAAEWSTALDALQTSQEVDVSGVGYWGLSLATQYGLGFVARERRVRAAVLGLFGLPVPGPRVTSYADRVRCPIFFIQQLHDEVHPPERVQALFDRLATRNKTLHASPGLHQEVPPLVHEAAYQFLAQHLGPALNHEQ